MLSIFGGATGDETICTSRRRQVLSISGAIFNDSANMWITVLYEKLLAMFLSLFGLSLIIMLHNTMYLSFILQRTEMSVTFYDKVVFTNISLHIREAANLCTIQYHLMLVFFAFYSFKLLYKYNTCKQKYRRLLYKLAQNCHKPTQHQ